MGWVRLDDAFTEHPKYLQIGPLGGYLSIAAIAWANRNLTDGFIPHGQVGRLVNFTGFAHHMWMGELMGGGDDAHAADLADELVAVGLWEEVEGGYRIHDYHDWQPTRTKILAARDDARKRQQKSRAPRNDSPANEDVTTMSQRDEAVSHGNVTALKKEEVRSKKVNTPEEAKASSTPAASPQGEENPDYRRLSHKLASGILAVDAGAKVRPDSKSWLDAMRLLVERDGRSVELADQALDWLRTPDANFWSTVVLSAPKFRQQFTKLVAKMNARPAVSRRESPSDLLRALDGAP